MTTSHMLQRGNADPENGHSNTLNASQNTGGSSEEKRTVEDDLMSIDSSASGMGNAPALTAKQEAAKKERDTLGKRESRAILILRAAVVLLFLLIGISSGVSVYFLVYTGEESNFEKEFEFYADTVIDAFILGVQRKMSAIDTLSVSITSHAMRAQEEFPYVSKLGQRKRCCMWYTTLTTEIVFHASCT